MPIGSRWWGPTSKLAFATISLAFGLKNRAKRFFPLAGSCRFFANRRDAEIAIDADERRCKVNTSFSEFEMPSEDPSAFPGRAGFGDAKYHELTAGVLRTMIRRTTFAAAKQDTKYAITGILWEVEDKKVRWWRPTRAVWPSLSDRLPSPRRSRPKANRISCR